MRLAFYAPLKPPDHPTPSGDRAVARLLMRALESASYQVELACHLRSRDGAGDPERQRRLAVLGQRAAAILLGRYRARPAPERPRAWLTYHLYYKAPDWIGPAVARGLGIPYLPLEASLASKRAGGPWDPGHRAVVAALAEAAAVVTINPHDAACLPDPSRVRPLAPFLDPAPFAAAPRTREKARAELAAAAALDPSAPWLLTVAMMRPGDKLASYRLLAGALARIAARPWQLLIAGDGAERGAVERAFAPLAARVRFLGAQENDALPALYAASDLLVWPAIGEAYGMALLEAQASGLPAVAGATGGVPAVLADGQTGLLAAIGDEAAFAAAVAALLDDPARRRTLGAAARAKVLAEHSLAAAAERLSAILAEVTGAPAGGRGSG